MKAKTDTRYFRDPALPGIDVCSVSNSRHSFPTHFHDDQYIISLITSGACRCVNKGPGDRITPAGGLTLINPGQIHSGTPVGQDGLGYTNCFLNLEAMTTLADTLGLTGTGLPEFTDVVIKDPLAAKLLANLLNTLTAGRDSLEKEAALVSTFHFLFSRYGEFSPGQDSSGPRHQPVVRAREILASQLAQKLSLKEVSQRIGLSQYHFLRTFKRETGMSPHVFRTVKRLERAKQLLKQKVPPAQVALDTGFTDQSHFTTTFRKFIGATPKQYQTNHRDVFIQSPP